MMRSMYALGISSMLALTSLVQTAQAQSAATGKPSSSTTVVVVKVTDNEAEREATRRLLGRFTKATSTTAQQVNGQRNGASGASAPSATPAVQPVDPIADATAEQIRSQTKMEQIRFQNEQAMALKAADANNAVLISQARVAEDYAATDNEIRRGDAVDQWRQRELFEQEQVQFANAQDMERQYNWIRDSENAFQQHLFSKQALGFGNIAMSQQILTSELVQSDLEANREQRRLDMTQQAVGYPLGELSRPIGGLIWAVGWGDDRKHDDEQRAFFDRGQQRLYDYQGDNMNAEQRAAANMETNLKTRLDALNSDFMQRNSVRPVVKQRPPANSGGAPTQQP